MGTVNFHGFIVGNNFLAGTVDGEPLVLISRPGHQIVTIDEASGDILYHESMRGDLNKIAFDSSWIADLNIIASGSSYAATSPDAEGYYSLCAFDDLGYTPYAVVYESCAEKQTRLLHRMPVKVTSTGVFVRSGDGAPRYGAPGEWWRPTGIMTYLVLGVPINGS